MLRVKFTLGVADVCVLSESRILFELKIDCFWKLNVRRSLEKGASRSREELDVSDPLKRVSNECRIRELRLR
jgi:hypothetical protein